MSKKKIWLFAVNGFCLLCILAGIISMSALRNLLPSQMAADRWKGESKIRFSQVSVFTSPADALTEKSIFGFQSGLDTKLAEAGLTAEEGRLWADSYCTMGLANVSVRQNSISTDTIAVGGDFFLFHPLKLLDGQYIAGNDLMKDRVLVNEMLAWKLYGGREIAGMDILVNGISCVIAGVFETENDFATEIALNKDEPLMIMAYDLYANSENAEPICEYEIVMPNPLSGFASQIVTEQFGKLNGAETVDNSVRFSDKNIRSVLKNVGSRAMHKSTVRYPYWENAARCVESNIALLWILTLLFSVLPVLTALYYIIKLVKIGKKAAHKGRKKLLEKIEIRREKRWAEKNDDSDGFGFNNK